MLSLLKYNLFLLGLVSLFAIPNYDGFILAHIFLLICFFLAFANAFLVKHVDGFYYYILVILSLSCLYFAATILGAVLSDSLPGLITSVIFLLNVITFLLITYLNDKLILNYVKGFVYSAFITGVIIIISTIFFYSYHINIIEVILPKILIESKAGEHTLTNIINIGNFIFFRPAGLSWDTGISVTGLTLALIIVMEKIVEIKHKTIFILLSVIAIFLSISKTSIITLLFYLIFKITKKILRLEYSYKIDTIVLLTIIAIFLYLGLFIQYTGDGNERHLKYFSSLFYYLYQNPLHILFGYGYTGVGVFFNHSVPWFRDYSDIFYFGKNLNPESTLTNIFLYGGILGSIWWIYSFIFIFANGNPRIRNVAITIVLLSFGYGINSVWFNSVYVSILILSVANIKKLRRRNRQT